MEILRLGTPPMVFWNVVRFVGVADVFGGKRRIYGNGVAALASLTDTLVRRGHRVGAEEPCLEVLRCSALKISCGQGNGQGAGRRCRL
jgi:hypothetical protein